ncbi:hypothetical protein RQP54_09975 [Curvibacter sp. APW13]|uniref:hypothetical protein n=1 Tax=Curvibacter sp. APW13 TaxID=3077236 RepID=UPI0028DF2BDB|nr:hypothetical protein [Curvibacter sp. APW13]MDT8991191.1 hypothetical protein [Curvibacter sp. APW13]
MNSSHLNRRHAMALGLGAAVVGGWGCATAVVSSQTSTSKTVEGDVVLSDDILAFGRADEAMAKSMGKADVVAFLGAANTYLLVEGGSALLAMTQLDPARLSLTPDNHRLYLKDKTVWGTLEFNYTSDAATATDAEKALFKTLGFVRTTPQTVRRMVSIKGAVYPAIQLQGAAFTAMQKPRPLRFHAPPSTETKPNIGAMALLPAAIVVDVVTAPLQLLGGLAVLISLGR